MSLVSANWQAESYSDQAILCDGKLMKPVQVTVRSRPQPASLCGQVSWRTQRVRPREENFQPEVRIMDRFFFFCVSPFSPENGTTVNSLAKVTQLPGEVVSRYDPEHRCYMRQGAKMGYI